MFFAKALRAISQLSAVRRFRCGASGGTEVERPRGFRRPVRGNAASGTKTSSHEFADRFLDAVAGSGSPRTQRHLDRALLILEYEQFADFVAAHLVDEALTQDLRDGTGMSTSLSSRRCTAAASRLRMS